MIISKYGEDGGVGVLKLVEELMGVAYGRIYWQVGIDSLCKWLSLLKRATVYSFGMTIELGTSF